VMAMVVAMRTAAELAVALSVARYA
jgi:hypothetical protein